MNASHMLRRYLKGQNVAIEYHWLEGQFERLPALMADLVRRRVAVIATPAGNYAAQAAHALAGLVRYRAVRKMHQRPS